MAERFRPSKNIMRRFRITELSAVDRPAQEAAQMTIIKREPGAPIRQVPVSPYALAAATHPVRHDDDPEATRLLKLDGVTALTFEEALHMSKLEGEDRRAFLLANHETRKGMMPAKPEDSEDEDEDMTTFEQAVEKLAGPGVPRTAAMRKARAAYPDLFAKYQQAPANAQVAKAAQADADAIAKGVSRRHAVDAAITERMMSKKVTRLDALSALRRERPEMFAEAAA